MAKGKSGITPADGKQFSKDYQPANRGRKPMLFSQIIQQWKDAGYEQAGEENVRKVYEFLLSLPLTQIHAIAGVDAKWNFKEGNDYPIMMRIAARDLLKPRGFEIVQEMLTRAQGKPKQQVDHTSGGEKISGGTVLSAEQEEALSKILRGG